MKVFVFSSLTPLCFHHPFPLPPPHKHNVDHVYTLLRRRFSINRQGRTFAPSRDKYSKHEIKGTYDLARCEDWSRGLY